MNSQKERLRQKRNCRMHTFFKAFICKAYLPADARSKKMKKEDRDSVKKTVKKIGKFPLKKRVLKKTIDIEGIDEHGTRHSLIEEHAVLNDCGHIGEAGALCAFCSSFSLCGECAKSGKFACSSCGRIVCSKCAKASVFHPPNRFCPKCAPAGFLSLAFRKRE